MLSTSHRPVVARESFLYVLHWCVSANHGEEHGRAPEPLIEGDYLRHWLTVELSLVHLQHSGLHHLVGGTDVPSHVWSFVAVQTRSAHVRTSHGLWRKYYRLKEALMTEQAAVFSAAFGRLSIS